MNWRWRHRSHDARVTPRRLFMQQHVAFARGLSAALCVALAAISSSTFAQGTYPNKPIRMVVSVGAGGATDTLARKLAEKLSVSLGHQVYVENQPAASGVIAAQAVKNAAPDGYTILIGTN